MDNTKHTQNAALADTLRHTMHNANALMHQSLKLIFTHTHTHLARFLIWSSNNSDTLSTFCSSISNPFFSYSQSSPLSWTYSLTSTPVPMICTEYCYQHLRLPCYIYPLHPLHLLIPTFALHFTMTIHLLTRHTSPLSHNEHTCPSDMYIGTISLLSAPYTASHTALCSCVVFSAVSWSPEAACASAMADNTCQKRTWSATRDSLSKCHWLVQTCNFRQKNRCETRTQHEGCGKEKKGEKESMLRTTSYRVVNTWESLQAFVSACVCGYGLVICGMLMYRIVPKHKEQSARVSYADTANGW